MLMHRSIFVATVLATGLVFTASAQSFFGSDDVERTPAGLQAAIQAGFRVEKSFTAISGLKGWVLQGADGQYNVYYTTPDGQALIAGALVSSTGENLTQRYAELHIPKPDLSALYERFENSDWIATGAENPTSVIYAIMDPNCIYCHYLHVAIKAYEAAGLQVRWIPVGFLRDDSLNKAAQILVEGAEALEAQQAAYGTPDMPAGIPVTSELKTRLDANLALMREAAINGTPGILYRDANGEVMKLDGMPMLSDLPKITGLPEQPNPDPRLDRFR